MLPSRMFVARHPRLPIPNRSETAKLQPPSDPPSAPRAATPTAGQTVCKLVTLRIPTDACIPFLFNTFAAHRSCCGSTETFPSPFLSSHCKLFPLQQGGYTPPPERSSRRANRLPGAPAARRGANLAGEGRLSHFVLESAALEHLQRAMIQGAQPRGDTGRTIACVCAGCGTIARTETIERKRRS